MESIIPMWITMPVDNGTAIFAYRTDLLQEAGYTIDDMKGISWDKWIEVGKAVYEKTGKYLMSMCAICGSRQISMMHIRMQF